MEIKSATTTQKMRNAPLWAGIIALVFIAACSSEKTSDATKPAVASANPDTLTTAAVSSASGVDNKLEFFTERYLASEERLKRRQDRIEQALTAQQ